MQVAKLTRTGKRITLIVEHTDSAAGEAITGQRSFEEWVAKFDRADYPTDAAWLTDAGLKAHSLAATRNIKVEVSL